MGKLSRAALALSVSLALAAAAAATEREFPFDSELLLDADPLPGSKRVPSLEIGRRGEVTIDLWCDSVSGQLVVAGETLTVLAGPRVVRSCGPERTRGDEDLLAALLATTAWRREGNVVTFEGVRRLRFLRPAN